MNLTAVAGLPARPITAVWYRAVDPGHLPTALNYSHTRMYPSRYNAGLGAVTPFDVVYFANNHQVALFEVGALYGSPLVAGGITPNPRAPEVIITAQLQLTRVADLTHVAASHTPLLTTAQELTGDWRGYAQRNARTSVSGARRHRAYPRIGSRHLQRRVI